MWSTEHAPSVAHKDIVQHHFIFMSEAMDTRTGLVHELWSSGVLDWSERDEVLAIRSMTGRNEKLLLVLSRKTTAQFQTFLDILDKTGQGHIRKHITGKAGR